MTVYSHRRIIRESYPALLLAAVLSLGAGVTLNSQIETIRRLPLILMMIPPINGINNNVCSILGSRLTSALHLGTIEPRFGGQIALRKNVHATWLMSTGTFCFTAAIFFLIAMISGIGLVQSTIIILAFFAASMAAIAATMLCTIGLAFLSFKRRLDPDNIVIPIVTSLGDIVGVTCLIIAMKIIGV